MPPNVNTDKIEDAKKELAHRILAQRHFLDFTTYMHDWFRVSWHHILVAKALEQIESGELKRLMIFLPPRHSKSEMVSVNFPAWILGRDKDKSVIQASYSADLATEFGRQARNIVGSKEYKNIFDTSLAEDSQSKSVWSTNGRGKYNALGVGGAATGKGADILIIDDPIKNRKEADSFVIRDSIFKWYQSTARTRLSPTGRVVLCVTRWHDDDLAGRILASEGSEDWKVICLPAIAETDEEYRKKGEALWPGQYNLENLLKTKQEIGSYEWSSLYQQQPLNAESQEFKPQFFRYKTKDEVANIRTTCWITIDTAVKETNHSDYTGTVINRVDEQNNWYISSNKQRMDSAKLINYIFKLWEEEHPNAMGIEETTYYDAIYPFLKLEMVKRNVFPVIYPLKHHGTKKELRIRGLLPRYEAGKIFHILGETETLEEELLRFPKGIHDDEIDSEAYQEQICQAPEREMTYMEQIRQDMELSERTGYYQ